MTTNEVQDTLLSDKELEVKIIRDALHMHKLWFKDGRIMPRYLSKLLELMDKYENKETDFPCFDNSYTMMNMHTA